MRRTILTPLLLLWVDVLSGQTSFSLGRDEICFSEQLEISNSSIGATTYTWDFCTGDILEDPSSNIYSLTGIGDGFGYDLVEDGGQYYGFLVDKANDKLFRLDYYSDPMNADPDTIDLGNPDGLLDNPESISIKKFDNLWYGVVGYQTNGGSLTRIDFGNEITNRDLDGIPLGSYGFTGQIREVKLEIVSNNLYLLFSYYNTDEFVVVNYRDSFDNAIDNATHVHSSGDLNGGTYGTFNFILATGFDIVFKDGIYIVYVQSQFSTDLLRVYYGNGLLNVPTSVTAFAIAGVAQNIGFDILREGSHYYGFISSISQPTKVLDLGELAADDIPQELTYGVTFPTGETCHAFRVEGSSYLKVINGSTNNDLSFNLSCGSSTEFSSDETPAGITYSTPGEKGIELTTYNSEGIESFAVDTVTVLPQTAPSISYILDNVCVSSQITFTPSNTGLTLYEWDFDGDDVVDVTDMTGANQSFDYSGLGTGTYTVRLDVSDGTCNNFFEQEITIYAPPPVPTYSYSSVRTCINADFTFTNNTLDGSYMGPLEYLWEFIDEPSGTVVATATTKDAVYAFETDGEKTVRLTSSIPGCIEVTEQTLMITPGPTADFFAASVCQNEAMQFTNTSTDANSYSWEFGDGFMSTATNPSHIFVGAGNYFVTLTATDAEGCEDTEVIEVAVSDSPQINFDFDIPCTSADGIQFFDLSTVDNADLVSWTWFVDDIEVSIEQSPMIVFSSTGVKDIRVNVQSSNGCESSYSEEIDVLSSPTPDFSINLGCQGETSTFTDNTISAGNPIISWLWTVDGVSYGTQDINHVFSTSGMYDVTLEVTGQNFCPETITKSIEIIELPAVSFTVDGECDNQLIRALDQSTNSSDPIIARRWMLDGASVGSGTQLLLANLTDDTYELVLELETQAGCLINSSQILEINSAPQSSFTSSRTYGIPNDQLTFTNISVGGISYQWLLNGEVRSTDSQSESITFANPGTYDVSLVTENSLGCNDTTSQEILIAIPEVDLAIGSFELVNENNVGRIFLEVQNFSNLPIEITEAQIVLENTFTITEQIVNFIDVGESSLISLNVGIPLTVSEPSYFCVKLSSQYVDYLDIQPVNNEKCITIEPVIRLEDPFPNPVIDQFRLKLVVNEASTANVSLINSAGKIQINKVENVIEGLNNFFIDMSILDPGIYYIIVEVQGTIHRRKVIKL